MNLKFLQLNIWLGGRFHKNIIDLVGRIQPDIIAFQEVLMPLNTEYSIPEVNLIDTLKKTNNFQYCNFAPQFAMYGKKTFNSKIVAEMGSAILSKFSIQNVTQDTYFGKYESYDHDSFTEWMQIHRVLHTAEIELPTSEKLIVSTTHGMWDQHGHDTPERIKMSEFILNSLKKHKKVIFSGDLNTYPNTKTISMIEESFTNVFKGDLETTFNIQNKIGGNYAHSVVDYVFTTPNITVLKKYSDDFNVSDHKPLICELEV